MLPLCSGEVAIRDFAMELLIITCQEGLMKKQIVIVVGGMLFAGSIHAADLGIEMSVASQPSLPGDTVRFICEGAESSESTLEKARITIKNPAG